MVAQSSCRFMLASVMKAVSGLFHWYKDSVVQPHSWRYAKVAAMGPFT